MHSKTKTNDYFHNKLYEIKQCIGDRYSCLYHLPFRFHSGGHK